MLLSDDQQSAILRAVAPLQRQDEFLAALAARLQQYDVIGDGELYRQIAAIQRQFWDPPTDFGPPAMIGRGSAP